MGIKVKKYSTSKLQKSFAIVIVACVAIIYFSNFDDIQAKSRDVKRRSDAKNINRALDLYFDRHNYYPEMVDFDFADWDTTYEPKGEPAQFIPQLTRENILNSTPRDPLNTKVYFYRYKKFPAGTYGCQKPFAVFQIFNFETFQNNLPAAACPDYNFTNEVPNGLTIQKFE